MPHPQTLQWHGFRSDTDGRVTAGDARRIGCCGPEVWIVAA